MITMTNKSGSSIRGNKIMVSIIMRTKVSVAITVVR